MDDRSVLAEIVKPIRDDLKELKNCVEQVRMILIKQRLRIEVMWWGGGLMLMVVGAIVFKMAGLK